MLITMARLQNIGPFASITLNDLGSLVVLVGPNGSGKSFILESLYKLLQEFQYLGGASTWASNSDYWHKRDTSNPISIEIEAQFSPEELNELATGLPEADRHSLSGLKTLLLRRSLHFEATWKTDVLQLSGETLVEDDLPGDLYTRLPIGDRLKTLFAGRMRLLSTAVEAVGTGDRPTAQSEALSELTRVASSRAPRDENRFGEARGSLSGLLGTQLETGGGQLLFQSRKGPRLPSSHLGRGQRAAVDLYWNGQERDLILAIDEPEAHLPPPLARDLFQYLKSKQERTAGQVWIATHSPMMLDTVDVANNWVIQRGDPSSSAKRLEAREDLGVALTELGALASDILMADVLVFVEGETERHALPVLAAKLGSDFEPRIRVVSMHGASQSVNYLKILLALAGESPIQYVVLLDKGSVPSKEQLIKELKTPDSAIVVWSKACFEDFYPDDHIRNGLKALFDVEYARKDIKGDRKDKQIETILKGRNRGGWKVPLASYVASHMAATEIPEEIVTTIQKIGNLLK